MYVRLMVAILGASTLLTCATARADEAAQVRAEADYRDAIEQGVKEFELHHYEEARSLFMHAHALQPNARTHRALGLVEFELRNYDDCIRQLEAAQVARVKPLDAAMNDEVGRVLARAYGFVARVHVDLRPPSTALSLDGRSVTLRPDALLLLRIGEHSLQARAEGFQSSERTLTIKGGEELRVSFLLERAPEPGAAKRTESRPLAKNPWLWSGLGVLVAGAAVGLAVGLTREPSEPASAYGGSTSTVVKAP